MSPREPAPRLGRGLAALIGDEAGLARGIRAGVQTLPMEALEPSHFQPRGDIDPGSLTELVDSIRARGILQPLLVRPHPDDTARYQIIAGERRWRAAQTAGLHEVPVLVRDLGNSDAMAAALVENLQREDLDPIEEADGYKRLAEEFGMTQEKLAEAVGKSRSHVANTMRLLNLPPSVQADVRRGVLSAGHARALLAHPEPAKAALAVISGGLNVRQTEALTSRNAEAQRSREPKAERDPETAALERDLSERLGLRVDIAFDGKGGTVRIRYRTLEQLDGLVALLTPR
jgi:ParB family chromosome partitioning protein